MLVAEKEFILLKKSVVALGRRTERLDRLLGHEQERLSQINYQKKILLERPTRNRREEQELDIVLQEANMTNPLIDERKRRIYQLHKELGLPH